MTRVRVGVNLLWLVPGVVGGSEEYTVRLLAALRDLDPDDVEPRRAATSTRRRRGSDVIVR